jgi:RHS repeat-associated protein
MRQNRFQFLAGFTLFTMAIVLSCGAPEGPEIPLETDQAGLDVGCRQWSLSASAYYNGTTLTNPVQSNPVAASLPANNTFGYAPPTLTPTASSSTLGQADLSFYGAVGSASNTLLSVCHYVFGGTNAGAGVSSCEDCVPGTVGLSFNWCASKVPSDPSKARPFKQLRFQVLNAPNPGPLQHAATITVKERLDDGKACTLDTCTATGPSYTPITTGLCAPPPATPESVAVSNPANDAAQLCLAQACLAGALDATRAGVVTGIVRRKSGAGVVGFGGVEVAVLNEPNLGKTTTKSDGTFELAVNGGAQLTLTYSSPLANPATPGERFITAQRHVKTQWHRFARVDDVELVKHDDGPGTVVTTTAGATAAPSVVRGRQIAAGEDDILAARRATMLIPSGLASANSGAPLPANMTMHLTEFTVGQSGLERMPGTLPATSAYTYAFDAQIDEVGASRVDFNKPIPFYVENFLNMAVGTNVPVGFYDDTKGQWFPETNGRVMQIVSITPASGATPAIANIASLTDGVVDTGQLTALNLSVEERRQLAATYTAGTKLWRTPLSHFSKYDCNFGVFPPDGAKAHDAGAPQGNPKVPTTCKNPVNASTVAAGSSVVCQNQTLLEDLAIPGTPLRLQYASDRSGPSPQAIRIPLKVPGQTLTPAPKAVAYRVDIAGRRMEGQVAWTTNMPGSIEVTWDGLDLYGRQVQGALIANVGVGNVYGGTSYGAPARFAQFSGVKATGSAARQEVTLWSEYEVRLQAYDMRGLKFGGWTLSNHHFYDSERGSVGDAEKPDARTWTLIAGNGTTVVADGPALNTAINANSILAMPDGSLLVTHNATNTACVGTIRRIDRNGTISTIAGVPAPGFTTATPPGNGQAFLNTCFRTRQMLLHPVTGELYILVEVATSNYEIWRVQNGLMKNVIAGVNTGGGSRMAFDASGALYLAQSNGLFKINEGQPQVPEDEVKRRLVSTSNPTVANLQSIYAQALISNGSGFTYLQNGNAIGLYQVSANSYERLVNPDVPLKNGGPTNIFFGSMRSNGTQSGSGKNGIYSLGALDSQILQAPPSQSTSGEAIINSATVDASGAIYIVADGKYVYRGGVPSRTVIVPSASFTVPSDDGSMMHAFGPDGRHLKTVSARSGATMWSFGYNANGILTSMTNASGEVTTIDRATPNLVRILAPKGQETTLTIDSAGYLTKFEQPVMLVNGQTSQRPTWTFAHSNGKITSQVDARGYTHSYKYDASGRVTDDTDGSGATMFFSRSTATSTTGSGSPNPVTITRTSPEGRVFTYKVERSPLTGDTTLKNSARGNGWTTITPQPNGQIISKSLLATETDTSLAVTETETPSADPRFGLNAPIRSTVTELLGPSSVTPMLAMRRTETRTAALSSASDPFSNTTEVRTVKMNRANCKAGDTSCDTEANALVATDSFNRAANTRTLTSAEGRQTTITYDAKDRVIQTSVPGIAAVNYTYFADGTPHAGRLQSVTQGTRSMTFSYFPTSGYLQSATDHTGRVTTFERDTHGRATKTTLPGGRIVTQAFDAAGNPSVVTPPGAPAHNQSFEARDLMSLYVPPSIGGQSVGNRSYTYNGDRQLSYVDSILHQYAPSFEQGEGKLKTISLGGANWWTFTRDSFGRMLTAQPGFGVNYQSLTHAYAGSFLKSAQWGSTATDKVQYDYNHHFLPSRIYVGVMLLTNAFDKDDAYSGVGFHGSGGLTLSRNAQNGRIEGSTVSSALATPEFPTLTEASSFDATYGELSGITVSRQAGTLYSATYARDALGRVTGKTETVNGIVASVTYSYDASGRLASETRGGTTTTWGYDLNGNRTTINGVVAGVVDAQDRYTPSTGTAWTYTTRGETQTKPGGINFAWDEVGNLVTANVGGTSVSYAYDSQGRRVTREVGGVTTRYLYDGQLRVVGEVHNTTQQRVFVYGAKSNVPDVMMEGTVGQTGGIWTKYRIISDQLGSVRLVVRMSDGVVMSKIDYDAWGNILPSSTIAATGQPGSQPFGFAGGLRDVNTGYTHFGARDYDPAIGRWVSKDPIRWEGGANFYAYCSNDPVNLIDVTGRMELPPDPSGLGPDWVRDYTLKHPTSERYLHKSGDWLRFDRGNGTKGFGGPDHWHHSSKPKYHFAPGDVVPDPPENFCADFETDEEISAPGYNDDTGYRMPLFIPMFSPADLPAVPARGFMEWLRGWFSGGGVPAYGI